MLPSLRHVTVTVTPSLGHVAAWLGADTPVMRGPALVVDDPTLDLPIGRAEADAATRRLSEYGLDVVRVSGPDATLPRVTQAAAPASLVHVAAHDRADPFQPERCGLVLSTGPLPPGIAELLAEPPAPLAADPPTVVDRRAGEI